MKERLELVEIIQKQFRSHHEMEKLSLALKSFLFFKEHNITKYHELLDIAHCLKYEHSEKNDVVFNYGEEGDRFYLVIDGTADVYVPVLTSNLNPSTIFK